MPRTPGSGRPDNGRSSVSPLCLRLSPAERESLEAAALAKGELLSVYARRVMLEAVKLDIAADPNRH